MTMLCADDALLELVRRWNANVLACDSPDIYPGASACLTDLLADFYRFLAFRRGWGPMSGCVKDVLEFIGADSLLWDCDTPAQAQIVCDAEVTCEPHTFGAVQVSLASHAFIEIGVTASRAVGQGFFPLVVTGTGFSVSGQMVLDDDCYRLDAAFVATNATCPLTGDWTFRLRRYASDATWECSECEGEALDDWTESYSADLTNVGREGVGGTTAWWMLRIGQTAIAPESLDVYGQPVSVPCPLDCQVTGTQYRYVLTIFDESTCSRRDPIAFTPGETYQLGLQLQSSPDGVTWTDADVTPDGDTVIGGTATPTTTPNTGWSGGYKLLTGVEIDTGDLTAAGTVGGVAAAGALDVPEYEDGWCLPAPSDHSSNAQLLNDGTTPTWSLVIGGDTYSGDLAWNGTGWTFSDTIGANTVTGTLTVTAKGAYPSSCATLKRAVTWMLTGGGFDFGSFADADYDWSFDDSFTVDTGSGKNFSAELHATCHEVCCFAETLYEPVSEALQDRSYLLAVTGLIPSGCSPKAAAFNAWAEGSVHSFEFGELGHQPGFYAHRVEGEDATYGFCIYMVFNRGINSVVWRKDTPDVQSISYLGALGDYPPCCPELVPPDSWGSSLGFAGYVATTRYYLGDPDWGCVDGNYDTGATVAIVRA